EKVQLAVRWQRLVVGAQELRARRLEEVLGPQALLVNGEEAVEGLRVRGRTYLCPEPLRLVEAVAPLLLHGTAELVIRAAQVDFHGAPSGGASHEGVGQDLRAGVIGSEGGRQAEDHPAL